MVKHLTFNQGSPGSSPGECTNISIVQWTEYGSSKPAIEVRILMGMPNKIELIYGKSIDKTKILCYTIYVKVKKDYYFKHWGVAKR